MPSTTGLGFQFQFFQQARLSKHVGVGWAVTSSRTKMTFRHVNHAAGLLGISLRWHNGAICTESPEHSKWAAPSWRNQRLTPIQWLDGFHLQFISLLSSTTLWICFPLSFNSSSDFFLRLQCQGPTFKSINCQIWIFFISSCSPFQFRSWTVKNVFTKC